MLVNERPIAPRAWQQRNTSRLLKILALAPAHRRSQAELIDLLWEDKPLKNPRHSLQQVITDARNVMRLSGAATLRLFNTANDQVVLSPKGGLWIDVEAFEQAAKTARGEKSADAYEAALALYAGDLLPEDYRDLRDWMLRRHDELRELALTLRLALAGLYERDGEDTRARELLEQIIRIQPADGDSPLMLAKLQDAYRMLMQLAAHAGDRRAALQHYHHLAVTLREFELAPDEATQELYNFLHAREERQPLPAEPPEPLSSFIGRAQDTTAVRRLLRQARLVTLIGPGGSGKTRLALECARIEARTKPAYWIDLAPLPAAALLPHVIAAALGIQEQGTDAIETRLVRYLRNPACLLVLDNCEHLIDAVARLAKQLLQACPELRILTTSRAALRLTGEHVWQVDPLAYPQNVENTLLDGLLAYDAVRLFVERAQAVLPSIALTAQNKHAVARICAGLEGMPLALELAAARVNTLSIQEIEKGVSGALGLLVEGDRAALLRHQTLRGAIDWSYALLSDAEYALWHRLSVFAGSFPLDAAEAICAEQSDAPTVEVLPSLVAKCMVQAQTMLGETRYRLLEIMRQYAFEKLSAAGETEIRRAKHYAYFLTLAERGNTGLTGKAQLEWAVRFTQEMDNLRAALEWASGESAPRDALVHLAAVLWRFWYVRGWLTEGRHWLDAALARDPTVSLPRVQALVGAATLAWAQGDFAQGQARCELAFAAAQAVNDLSSLAWVKLVLANIADYRGDFVGAAAWLTEALQEFEVRDETFGRALALYLLANVTHWQGNVSLARELLELSLQLDREIGNLWGAALALSSLGNLALEEGGLAKARAYFDQSLALFRALEVQFGIALELSFLGLVALEEGEEQRAEQLFQESLRRFEAIGDKPGTARAWHCQALSALRRRDLTSADVRARASLQLRVELGEQLTSVESLELLVRIALAGNRLARAAQIAGAVARRRSELGVRKFKAERTAYEPALAELRARLGDATFEGEWQRGETRPWVEVIQMALQN